MDESQISTSTKTWIIAVIILVIGGLLILLIVYGFYNANTPPPPPPAGGGSTPLPIQKDLNHNQIPMMILLRYFLIPISMNLSSKVRIPHKRLRIKSLLQRIPILFQNSLPPKNQTSIL